MNKLSVSQKAFKQLQRKAQEAHLDPKPHKRPKLFSKSRDVHEDRDTRQMKTDPAHIVPHVP